MKSYDLNLLGALDALLSTGSVTAAAQRMHLSTPAMSHTLARIREAVGDPILVRAGRKLVPTPRALAMAEPLRRLLADAAALLEPPSARSLAATRRHFVVRAPDGIAVVYGAALAEALQRQMPQASLQFVPEGHSDFGTLREGRLDLDIGVLRERDPEIEVLLLSQQALVGAVKAGHALLQGKLSAKRFAAARHVAMTPRPREASPVDAALAREGLARFVALTVPNGYAALVVAARSDLVACVPERMARGMQAGLGLEVFTLPLPVAAEPVVMAWHPRHGADPGHRWLRETLQQVLADSPWLPSPLVPMKAAARRAAATPDAAARPRQTSRP